MAKPAKKRDALFDYYAQWRRLTEEESEQIRLGNWHQVQSVQLKKRLLQKSIKEVTDALCGETNDEPLKIETIDREVQSVIHELMRMEIQNRNELYSRHEQAKAMIQEIETSRSTLRLVHKTYSLARPAIWQSYS